MLLRSRRVSTSSKPVDWLRIRGPPRTIGSRPLTQQQRSYRLVLFYRIWRKGSTPQQRFHVGHGSLDQDQRLGGVHKGSGTHSSEDAPRGNIGANRLTQNRKVIALDPKASLDLRQGEQPRAASELKAAVDLKPAEAGSTSAAKCPAPNLRHCRSLDPAHVG